MSHGQFIISLTAIAFVAIAVLYFGIRWQGRSLTEEPTEHGDGEP